MFLMFAGLQILDVLSTTVCLVRGVPEGNPIVRWTMAAAGGSLVGLLYAKTLAMLMGAIYWRSCGLSLLRRATVAYAAVVGWNLLALFVAAIQFHRLNA